MNELAPFKQNTLDIGIFLEEANQEGEKVTNEVNNNILMSSILYEIKSFRKFQETVESLLSLLENTTVSSKSYPDLENTNNVTPGLIENVLKKKISSMEREFNAKHVIKQLLSSKSSIKTPMKNRERKQSESFSRIKSSEDSRNDKVNIEVSNAVEYKTKFAVTRHSLRNEIHEKGLSKSHNVKMNNFPVGTSQTILENLDNLILNKPDYLIIHSGTNYLINGENTLNQANTIVKEVKKM